MEIVERNNEEVKALNFQMTDSDASKKHSRKSKPTFKNIIDKTKNQSLKDLKHIKEKTNENQTYFSQFEFITYLVKKYAQIASLYKSYMNEGEKLLERVEGDLEDFKTVCAFEKENQKIDELGERFGKYLEFRVPLEKQELTVLYICNEDEIILNNVGLSRELFFRFFCYYPFYDS